MALKEMLVTILGDQSELLASLGVLGLGLELSALALLGLGLPLLGLELWSLRRQGRLDRARIKGMLTSAFCLLPASLIQALCLGALIGLYFKVQQWSLGSISTGLGSALLCLLLVDLLYYWEHRLGHEVNVLWAMYHSVHHSASHYDQTIGARISFVDFFFSPLIYLPLVLIGFHPLLVLGCLGVVLAWQQWLHTELIGRLKWLDGWLNTPSNHRVHHGSNPEYLDKNYGGILMIWDRLFGTYEPERQPVVYGLVEPLESQHPVEVHSFALKKLWRRLKEAPSLKQALALLFTNMPF